MGSQGQYWIICRVQPCSKTMKGITLVNKIFFRIMQSYLAKYVWNFSRDAKIYHSAK